MVVRVNKSILLLLLLSSISFSVNASGSLKPFKTDFCTYFPEGTLENPNLWKQCCFDHDLRYWFGGSSEDMLLADSKLKTCVTARAGSFYGNLMYYGRRAGHFSPIKNEHKWSWGWSEERELSPLQSHEKAIINQELENLDLDQEYLEAFRRFYSL